ncbi:MAG: hypothetical protein P8O87_05155 [Crocinitomicaceae bacterium]|jgi:hypothetical protein|nr:hypothetical protein [Crocinitomicaceae bacterium]
MKYIFTLLSFIFISQIVFCQQYDELKILYADEDYKKLVAKSLKYTENEKTKKEVVPYIWAAKGLYAISESGETDVKYKNAYKDAIKYLSKGLKYDLKLNDGSTFEEFSEFTEEFKMSLFFRITNELESEAYKKAYSWAMKYPKITKNTVGAKYIAGACKYLVSDPGTSRTLWNEGDALLKEVNEIDSWGEADRNMLMMGVYYSARALKSKRQTEKAKAFMNKIAQWFEGNEDFKELYDEIVN